MPVTYAPMDFWHVVFARTGSAVPKIFPRAFGVAMIGAHRCHTRTAPATQFVPNSRRCLTGRALAPCASLISHEPRARAAGSWL